MPISNMGDNFRCQICGNDDPNKIGYLNGKPYCRACLSFNKEKASVFSHTPKNADYRLNYSLSEDQYHISFEILNAIKDSKNVLLKAVCGAGKTELTFEAIKYVIERGGYVGFATPRRDVTIELFNRFKTVFKSNKVIAIYGGNNDELDGDLICLTTHQLYRFDHYFDLLIIDEVDAFPFAGNEVLMNIALKSIKGNLIMMSATATKEIENLFMNADSKVLTLNSRYHGYPLITPEIIVSYSFLKYACLLYYLKKFLNDNKQVFVFTPTIDLCEKVYKFISIFLKNGEYVHSKRINRDEIINDFKVGKIKYLITTSILERGVTVKGLQVIVFMADHKLYDFKALVQISGRVGRKINDPVGRVIFLLDKQNEQIKKCVDEIKRANYDLQTMF